MCGIFGASIKPGANKKTVLANFKILGLYNIQRGRDSSGIFINREILKSTKEFDDFLEDKTLDKNFEGDILLGHNRAGSIGYKKTIEEAHPFLINDDLVFTHNGSIKNTHTLCEKYDIIEKDFNVDSKLLGTLLFTHGDNILTEYKGAAALAYTYLSNPDVLYLYHGESKEYKHGTLIEERPLFTVETETALYYSSLKSSLEAIRDSEEEEVKVLPHNTIFKIQNGEFLEEPIKIDREEANVTVYAASSYNANTSPYYYNSENFAKNYNSRHNFNQNKNESVENLDKRLIFKESYPIKVIESANNGFKINGDSFVYYHKGRYYDEPFKLSHGPKYLKKGGLVGKFDDDNVDLFYFFKGVLIKSSEDYKKIMHLAGMINGFNWATNPSSFNFAMEVSEYSQYPVTNLPSEYNYIMSDFFKHSWYRSKGEKKSACFIPKFSGRSYTIKDGILIKISSSHKTREKCLLDTPIAVEDQLTKLKNIGVQGGSSAIVIPFQENDDEPFWFFEKTYKTFEELSKDWDDDEYAAFDKFIRHTYERDFKTEVEDFEVAQSIKDITSLMIERQCSLKSILEKEVSGDSELLLGIYNDILDGKEPNFENETLFDFQNKRIPLRITGFSTKNTEETTKEDIEVIEEVSNNSEKLELYNNTLEMTAISEEEEESDNIVEECIIMLEDLQASSFELSDLQKSDFAQEATKPLLVGIDNLLSNLLTPVNKYKKVDLEKRIKKIRETKNLINGTV